MKALRIAWHTRAARTALLVLLAVTALAVFGGWLAPHDPLAQHPREMLRGFGAQHPLGTDYLGRDVLSRLLEGTGRSVFGAVEAVAAAMAVGVPLGLASLWLGRGVEWLAQRAADALMTLPFTIFAIAVAGALGNGLHQAMLSLGVLYSPLFFRMTRAAALGLRRAQYIEAAEMSGASGWRVLRTHVVSKILPTLVVTAAHALATCLLVVSSLTFLGVGVQPPAATWGGMLATDLGFLSIQPWAPLYPAALIVLTTGALNLLADAVRDAGAGPGERQDRAKGASGGPGVRARLAASRLAGTRPVRAGSAPGPGRESHSGTPGPAHDTRAATPATPTTQEHTSKERAADAPSPAPESPTADSSATHGNAPDGGAPDGGAHGSAPARETTLAQETTAAATGPAGGAPESAPVLSVDGLGVTVSAGRARAVREVSFTVGRGEAVGLVGESGSGKTLICRSVLGLLPPGCSVAAGRIALEGEELTELDRAGWDRVRGARLGAVFQDPASYLNPSLTVGRQLSEPLRLKLGLGRKAAARRAVELFAAVGLREPSQVFHRYPHELSGGMLQRVLISIALACEPGLLVADEATTALDVVVQAEVLDLLAMMREEHDLALLLVTHDLAVVAEVCDRVLVCYAGELVEEGPTRDVLDDPAHPYTQALLRVASATDFSQRELEVIPGEPPEAGAATPGCRFADRCGFATDACLQGPVPWRELPTGRRVRCVRAEELELTGAWDAPGAVGTDEARSGEVAA
jgi:oligopeptide/dipeptide ABC transporter ATP-binding protein